MKSKYTSCLLLSVVLLFAIRGCFAECFIETVKGAPQYHCHSIQDLEEQPNSDAFDVFINKPTDPSSKTLKLKITLVDDVSNNRLSPKTFKLLKQLGNLFKLNADIGALPADVFEKLPIQELNLRHNGINNIEAGAFSTLERLNNLYIVDNKLSTVKVGVFNNLPCETLALSRNRISFIEKDAFKSMINLKRLHLDGNRLSEFQPDIIMNNPGTLEELLLQNNLFTDIDRNTFRGLTSLKHLNMDHNRISQCASYTFDDASHIENLNLANNLLTDFKAEAFPSSGMQNLQKLYIQNNRLSYLTTLMLERLRNLKGIRMGGNPWQCSCLDAISTWLRDHNVHKKCDQDYYYGMRPVCVVYDSHPTRCVYENDASYYVQFSEINNKSPQSPDCVL